MSPASGSAGVLTTDLALVVQSWDAWMAEATGVPEEEARGRALAELYPELERRGLLARLARSASLGTVEVLAPAFHAFLIPCAPRSASAHFARMQQHVTIAPLRSGEALVGLVVTIEDVTARRDRERELAAQLASPDDVVRLQAVRALSEGEVATEPLAGALGDRSWRVRQAAAHGLASGDDDAVVDALIAALRERHRDPAVLNAALTALVHARHDVVPPIVALLDGGTADTDLRTYSALALGLLEDARAVPALVRALDDADANVRFHAIEALGRIRSREAAMPVAAVAESRDFSVAFAALDTLALIGEPSVAPRLVPLLDDELLQTAAIDALAQLGGEDVVAPLAAMLGAPGVPVATVAGALATLRARLETPPAERQVAPALARPAITRDGARALLDALPAAADADREPLVEVLGWLDVEGAERTLAGMLALAAPRRAIVDALAARGAVAVPPLLDVLATTTDDETRRGAAVALGRIGAPEAVPALIALLDGVPEVAVAAAGALGSIGDPRAFEPILSRLDDEHAAVRQAAVGALGSIGHPETASRVRALLDDASPRVRESATRVAGYFGFVDCVERVLALADDPDEAVRRAAVEQLTHLDDPRAGDRLRDALATASPGVRAAAVRALAHVDAADALAPLLLAAADADPWVRYYAARAVAHHRHAAALPTLRRLAVGDPVPPVRIAAIDALAAIGADDDLATLAALLPPTSDGDPMVARAALVALGRASDPATLAPLLDALRDPDRAHRLAALDALGRRADARTVDGVAALARRAADPGERAQALDVLGRIGGPAAVAALIDLLADPQRTGATVTVLASLDGPHVAWIGRGLDHPSAHVRCAVVEALGRLGDRAASPLLAGALRDAAPAVRAAAAYALQRADLRAARAGVAHVGAG